MTSLRQVDATVGHGITRRLGEGLDVVLKPIGLRCGVGCGVAVGYGYGAGIFVKPGTLHNLRDAIVTSSMKVAGPLLQRIKPSNSADSTAMSHPLAAHMLSTPVEMAALPSQDDRTLHDMDNIKKGIEKLESDFADLTKLVLQQQLSIEQVKMDLRKVAGGR